MVERIGTAERVLRRLGIDDPREIDVDAIAWDMGARVKYRPLDSCEARIVGIGDHAVITVNERSKLPRRRFSVAHELGHWTHHRHHLLMCRKEDIGTSFSPHSPERAADLFARDLLMPRFLFDPVARSYPKVTFAKVREIATLFQTSRTATAIRLVEGGFVSALLICHGSAGRKWFVPSPDVCSWCFPNNELSPDSFAFDILFGSKDEDPFPRRIGADAWFSYRGADRHEVLEQTVRVADQTILTLLFIEDDEMVAS